MGKAKIYGAKSVYIPNREADMRRRNNTFRKNRQFAENTIDRYEAKLEKKAGKHGR